MIFITGMDKLVVAPINAIVGGRVAPTNNKTLLDVQPYLQRQPSAVCDRAGTP